MFCRLFDEEKNTFFIQNDFSKLTLASTLIGQVSKAKYVRLSACLFVCLIDFGSAPMESLSFISGKQKSDRLAACKFVFLIAFWSVCLLPYLSIASLLWTVCPFFYHIVSDECELTLLIKVTEFR